MDKHINASDLKLRPTQKTDEAFLFDLYASTRSDEMSMLNWSDKEKTRFLSMQFHAQDTYYREQFRYARYDIIEHKQQAIGRLYVDRRYDEIRIIDIALVPAFRNLGLGRFLLEQIIEEAKQNTLPVTIHVEQNNPAFGLYTRLGFKKLKEQGVYYLMKWHLEDNTCNSSIELDQLQPAATS